MKNQKTSEDKIQETIEGAIRFSGFAHLPQKLQRFTVPKSFRARVLRAIFSSLFGINFLSFIGAPEICSRLGFSLPEIEQIPYFVLSQMEVVNFPENVYWFFKIQPFFFFLGTIASVLYFSLPEYFCQIIDYRSGLSKEERRKWRRLSLWFPLVFLSSGIIFLFGYPDHSGFVSRILDMTNNRIGWFAFYGGGASFLFPLFVSAVVVEVRLIFNSCY